MSNSIFYFPPGYEDDGRIPIPVQNVTFYCSGDESGIFDCPYDRRTPSSCSDHISIDCEGMSLFIMQSSVCTSYVGRARIRELHEILLAQRTYQLHNGQDYFYLST